MKPTAEFLSPAAREVYIAANPRAGARWQGGLIDDLSQRLQAAGFQATVFTDIDALKSAVGEALPAGRLRAVVSAGGDGTICRLAHETPPGTPLAILPLGTENLLARHLGLTADAASLTRLIERGCTIQQDAGTANGQHFNLMLGCGFDAEVVRRVHSQRKGHIQYWSYAQPIFDSILNYQYPELSIRYEPVPEPGQPAIAEQDWPTLTARWVFVVNVPRYACGLSFYSQATGHDGLLDLCTFREGSLWNGLLYLGGVYLGQHEGWKDFHHVTTRRLRIEGATGTPFQLDGDPGGELAVDVSILPGRLTLLVNESWLESRASGSQLLAEGASHA